MTTQNNIQLFGEWPFPTAINEPTEKLEKGFTMVMELQAILMAILIAMFNFLICFDSKSVLFALQNWDCKMRRDILRDLLIHCIMSRGIGIEFCWVPSLLE